VEAGLGEIVGAKARLDEIYAATPRPDADFDAWPGQAKGSDSRHCRADLDTQMEIAADALRLPPWDAVIAPLGRRKAPRRAVPAATAKKPPDMLLLDEPTNHLDAESVDWLEQFLVRYPGTVVAVTTTATPRQRGPSGILELDPGHGIPWKGNYTSWLEQKERAWRPNPEEVPDQDHEAGARMGAAEPQARQAKSKARLARFEELNSGRYQKRTRRRNLIRWVSASATRSSTSIRDQIFATACDRQPVLQRAARAHRRIIRPNGAGKSTFFR